MNNRNDFLINLHESYVAKLGFTFASPVSAVSSTELWSAINIDLDQTAHESSMVWVYTLCSDRSV